MENPIANHDAAQGIKCPRCGVCIPASITELIYARSLRCSSCQLQLFIDRMKSREALQVLGKVQEAQDKVNRTKNFKH